MLAAREHVLVAGLFGIAVTILVVSMASFWVALLCGWAGAALLFVSWTLLTILRMDATTTATHASREDPGRVAADITLIAASVASLVAVGLVLIDAHSLSSSSKNLLVGLSVLSVVSSWAVVHTIFTLRYARVYFATPIGGIDFNNDKEPRYSDFAYIAFTVGMTFQVSDTNFKSSEFRSMALRHALLSYLFGTVIVASAINLLLGLGH